ncbi:hypothetical protein F2Q70_00003570 [Brassica cretica]|uniref:Uncharacterized protein n=1 Tax=Brassica cretica TaxID=69181 RepID=A0A8S9IXH2_BRACR|nr:hypothetical protein F2Q70_00003570 [Brassica cretica]
MLDGVNYPLRDNIDSLTTHMNALKQEMDTIQRQLDLYAEQSPSIDTHSPIDQQRPCIIARQADIYQELKDISESTHARLGMQQRTIGNIQHRMNASEVARERIKNQWMTEEMRP